MSFDGILVTRFALSLTLFASSGLCLMLGVCERNPGWIFMVLVLLKISDIAERKLVNAQCDSMDEERRSAR